MTTFEDLGLNEAVLRGITREGFTTPTPIQGSLIPPVLEGRDCVGLSQTGSGKTAAFVLPILHKIAEEEQSAGSRHCRAIVVAPTRELAMQIMDNARSLAKFTKANVALLIGGTSYTTQIRAMDRGADLVVATPGRLIDHIESGYLALHRTHTIVLDEADQMMDMGFMPAIRQIMGFMPEKRQTVLLSATMPKQIRKLASDFLKKPFETEVTPQSKPVERIEQHAFSIKARDRRRSLLALLTQNEVEKGIIFTRTKRTADDVEMLLRKAGIQTFALHGDKSKGERNRALTSFKKGQIPVLVATDIAARGIDVDSVSHVINFEMPNVPEAYVHRVGRTARAGKEGVAFSLVAPAETKMLREIEQLTGLKLKMEQINIRDVEMPDRDAVAVQPPEDERRRAGREGGERGARKNGSGRSRSEGNDRRQRDEGGERRQRSEGGERRQRSEYRGKNEDRPQRREFTENRERHETSDNRERHETSDNRENGEAQDGAQKSERPARKEFGDKRGRDDRKPRGEFKNRADRGERRPSFNNNRRDDFEDRPAKRDPNAPAWNPIRAKIEGPEGSDDFAREETVRPKKKGGGRKQPKPGNHRKGQNRPASASGKPHSARRDGGPANNARSDRASPSKAKRPSEAAA